jgi:hypothetical protein
MRKFLFTLSVLITLVALFLSFSSLSAHSIVLNQVSSPTPTLTATTPATSDATVGAPFSDADTPYVLLSPTSDSIDHVIDDGLVDVYPTGVIATDFAASVRFYNPYSTEREAGWDYGFQFRDNANGAYYVLVTSSGEWHFIYRTEEGAVISSLEGEISNLNYDVDGSNELRLVVSGQKAFFMVNGAEIAVFDVSANELVGSIAIFTAYYTDNDIDGASTRFEDFTIWSLGLVPTMTPTAAAETGLEAEVGENEGEIEIGGGQLWTYEGEEGDIITIHVLADDPYYVDGETFEDGFDTIVTVRAENGTILAEADDILTGTDSNPLIENLVLPEDGTYEIEVRSWDNRSGGEYTLVIIAGLINTATPIMTPTPTPP